ncbi:hypothetical protein [Clostridium sp. JN-9]|uniref:hypothetical protein n=1 Tax=Clostridium sp. JN-9 TaxID=2507159 RepID=UPI001FAB23DC|nr:hypothetical protein [Clostridium sp. JN-9]
MFKKRFTSILLSSLIIIGSTSYINNAVKAAGINGWVKADTTWEYFINGSLKTGWLQIGAKWYYLNPDGSTATGWDFINGYWYYLNVDGDMATGWKFVNGNWYYLNASGSMATGWKLLNGSWYFLNPNGDIAANIWIGNYYMGSEGAMLVNTYTPDGYYVGANGLWDGKPRRAKTVYNMGETAVIHDSFYGTYELTVNSAELSTERNEYWDTNPAQVYKITYTYKLLSKGSEADMGLWIDGFDAVTDGTGEAGDSYLITPAREPKDLYNVGDFCTAETFVGVNNPTTRLVLTKSYYDYNLESLVGHITFNIPTK